jgi:autotransporter-associated beta strand protein
MRKYRMVALAASAALAGFDLKSMAASATWQPTAGGTYSWTGSDATNWSTGAHPGSAGDIATVVQNFAGAQTITLDANSITLGQLNIADTATAFFPVNISSGTYVPGTFTANTLVFDNGGSNAVLNNSGGTSNAVDTISANISLNSNLTIIPNGAPSGSNGSAGNFTLTGAISDGTLPHGILVTGFTTVNGFYGNTFVTGVNNTYTGPTTVENGTLQVYGDLLTSTNGPLGNAGSAISIGTGNSVGGTTALNVFSNGTVNNTISRALDFSGTNSATSTGGSSNLVYTAGAANSTVLTVSGNVTLGYKRATAFQAAQVGMGLKFTGLITGALNPSTPNGNNVALNLGATFNGTTPGGTETYEFTNSNNSFSANIALVQGTVLIAGNVPANTSATVNPLTPSPIGESGTNFNGGASAINLTGGNGGNIVTASNALAATRSVFMETPNTTMGRGVNPGAGSNTAGLAAYGTIGSSGAISINDGYRLGGTNTSGVVTWSGDIPFGTDNVGGNTKVIPIANNVGLISATGGIVNFTGRIYDTGFSFYNSSNGQATSNATRVTINGFRNHPYLDANDDGTPDSFGTNGSSSNSANAIVSPFPGAPVGSVTGGTVIINNPNQSDYWSGTTEVMGGTLLIDNNLGTNATQPFTGAPISIGDTVTVDSGATIGGQGILRSGVANSTLTIYGTLNPGDSTSTATTTRSTFSSEKPVLFQAGSNFTVDLNGAVTNSSGSPTTPGADELLVPGITSGNAVTLDNTSLATTPTLTINLGYQPVEGQFWTVIGLSGTAAISGTFAVSIGGTPTMLTQGSTFPVTFNGSTYTLTASYLGGSANHNLILTSYGQSGWAIDADGNYGDSSSWDDGVPNGNGSITNGAIANFGNVVTAIRNVNVTGSEYTTTTIFNAPNGGYNLSGAGGFLSFTTLNAYNGSNSISVNISSPGSINIYNSSQMTLSGRITGALKITVNNTSHLFLGNPAASNELVSGNPNNTPGTLFSNGLANGYGGGMNVSGGQLTLVSPGALPALSPLIIGSTGFVNAQDHGLLAKNNIFLSSLTIASLSGTTGAWSGKLDLANNDLYVQNGNYANILSQLKQGYNSGAWNGSGGIVSSNAAADTTHLTTLGMILNSVNGTPSGSVLYSAFDNITTSAGAAVGAPADVIVKYTYYGDTNLDGVVDGTDYARIDAAYLADQTSPTATGWYNGDFNYDGVVDGSDYTLIDNAYNSQGAQLAAEVATPTAEISGATATSAVPEPASLSLLVMGASGLLGRRRSARRSKIFGEN